MSNKKKFKIISTITTLFVITTLISLKGLIVKADVPNKPDFDIEITNVYPNPAVVGEDITISGKIIPKPFEITIPTKEIVLVLDVSGSMDEKIEIPCTNERVRYCTLHASDDSNHSGKRHNWINDYCVEHGKSGAHNIATNKKIDELKIAAKSFIEKMKNVPDLKIGIVAYSSIATTNPNSKNETKTVGSLDLSSSHNVTNYGSLGVNLLSSSDSRLTGIINNLEALGGTNTGEGMRKAIYMLENGDKAANKTIVLMTDGLPTFYSVEGNNKNNYMAIDNTNPQIAGRGSGRDTNAVNYSLAIGEIIKSRGYNAFSIGYGLDTDGNDTLLSIHESMIGTSIKDKPDLYENSGFFPTSGNAIQAVFDKIATKIIESYPINNIDMNINFTEGFSLNIGGNTVNVGNINYKKVSDNIDKVRYEADPIPFEFVIKANKEGEYKILDEITINYPWQNKIEKVDILRDLLIKVLSNEMPNISAKLKSEKKIELKRSGETIIEYEIEPIDFTSSTLNIESKKVEEAIFIADLSKDMKYGNRFSILQNAITNKVLGNSEVNPIKFGLIGYSDSISVGDIGSSGNATMKSINNIDNLVKPLINIDDIVEKEEFRKLLQENSLGKELKDTETRNIDGPLKIAKDILSKFGTNGKRKAIILINSGSVNYSKDVVQQIKQEGYKIISVDLSGTTNTNLKNLHVDLGGRISDIENDSDFLISKTDGGNFNFGDNDMEKVAKRLIEGIMSGVYNSIEPKIYFDLNNNFEYVDSSNSSNISLVSYGDNKLSFKISPINYFYSGIMKAGKYQYIAPKQTISFKLKVKADKVGTLTFGENLVGTDINKYNNYLFYNKFNTKESKSLIDTPTFTVKEEIKNLTHGLYNGIIEKEVNIQENDNKAFEIAQGSIVTFGSEFTLSGSNVDFQLNIDNKFNYVDLDDINIYKVTKDSSGNIKLIKLVSENKTKVNSNENIFKISLKDLNNNNQGLYTDILVVYKARIKDTSINETFKNEIKFDSAYKDVEIFTPEASKESPSLPDLF